jgi:5,10-methylenetetrahydromethanopterin reductase
MRACLTIDHLDWVRGHPATSVDRTLHLGRLVDVAGFDSIWLNEDPDGWDAFAVLAALSRETGRIRLGTGVTNPWHRHPNLIAGSVATLDRLSSGRSFLGLGRGEPAVYARAFGMETNRPLARLEESIALLRQWWTPPYTASGGDAVPVRTWQRSIGPLHMPPIYLAAVGPKTLALAGRAADGVLFNALATPEFVAWAVGEASRSALKAGRDPGDLSYFVNPAVIVTDDPEPVLERKKGFIAMVHALPGMDRLLMTDRWDVDSIVAKVRAAMGTEEIVEQGGLFVDLRQRGDLEAARRAIPTDLVAHAAAIGPVQVVREKLAHFEAAGATHLFVDRAGLPERLEDVVALVDSLHLSISPAAARNRD